MVRYCPGLFGICWADDEVGWGHEDGEEAADCWIRHGYLQGKMDGLYKQIDTNFREMFLDWCKQTGSLEFGAEI